MSNSIWMTVIKGNVDDNNRKVGVFHMFEVELKVHDVDGERRISLSVSPLEAAGGTAMLVECRLSIGREQIKIDRDVWCEEEIDIFSTPVAGCSGTIQLECSLIEFLPVVELSQQTPYRRFQVLCAPDSYFVDPFRLGQVGGALFTEWATKAEEDETRVVCQLDNVELRVLLEAVIGYESIVVHRRNFRRLCDVAERFKIVALLRLRTSLIWVTQLEMTVSTPPMIPSTRFMLAIMCFFGCLVQYTLRTNMSFAIVCMAEENKTEVAFVPGELNKCGQEIMEATNEIEGEFDWDRSTQGLILGAFFWGYLGSQVVGGMLASRYGGKRVIVVTILGASLLTLASPIAARTSPYILAGLRAAIGFLQGATFPAMHTMWSVWGPPLELSVLTGVTYAGSQIGNVIVLPLSGFLCQYGFDGGWPSIFYILGLAGLVWCAAWMYVVADRPSTHKNISSEEQAYIIKAVEASMGKQTAKPPPTPWGKILTSRAVWATCVGHFAGDWGAYTMLVSMPSFMKDVLGFDLSSLGIAAAIPYLAYFIIINLGGVVADALRSKKILSTVNTRRAAQLTALMGQAFFLVLSSYCGCGQEMLVIFYITIGMAISGLQYSGHVVNYLDIAPPFSGTIMGMGNTISCLAGILSPMVTSALTPNGTQEEWQLVMWVTAAILAIGSSVFALFISGEVQDWAKNPDSTEMEEVPLQEKIVV